MKTLNMNNKLIKAYKESEEQMPKFHAGTNPLSKKEIVVTYHDNRQSLIAVLRALEEELEGRKNDSKELPFDENTYEHGVNNTLYDTLTTLKETIELLEK